MSMSIENDLYIYKSILKILINRPTNIKHNYKPANHVKVLCDIFLNDKTMKRNTLKL